MCEQELLELGDAVVLTGRMITQVRVEGPAKRLESRVLTVWVRDRTWRLIAFQCTPR